MGGHCIAACDPGLMYCFGACLDTDVKHNNCGSCRHACTTAEICVGGMCQCDSAHPDACMGACVNKQNDSTNCGTCGALCPPNIPNCTAGQCH
jgi:hypothetical protein